jgi:putative transposase
MTSFRKIGDTRLEMRGRYNGCRMSVYGSIVPGARRLAKLSVELSKEARRRLKWFDYYHKHDCNGRLTCRHFDISPQTFYRWKRRYDPHNLVSLENRSCCPKRVRRPTWSPELVEAVLKLREQYPRWGKDKLVILVREQGFATSTSTVGRILRRLKDRGALREPLRRAMSASKRRQERAYARRKPRGYQAKEPGDIVEVDTLDLRPLPGVTLKQFTARDIVSRWDTLEVHSRATANIAATFLDRLLARMPFPIRGIQVDGGSEFKGQFEEECQRRKIHLFVLPPRSPKLNGHVERANRTHTEEFYEVVDSDFTVADLTPLLLEWEQVYNTVRPHQALGYLTPLQFLQQHYGKEEVSLRY